MTLIDYFNQFQEKMKSKRFSANARSLYFAILAEFNSARFPNTLRLHNFYLQEMSGINSTASFDSARTALINAQLISHKHQVYSLQPSDRVKVSRKSVEIPLKETSTTISVSTTHEDIDIDVDVEAASAQKSTNSKAVIDMWRRYNGQPLKALGFDLIQLENQIGEQQLLDLIQRAGRANKLPTLTYAYMIKFLKPVQSTPTQSTPTPEPWENDIDKFLEG